MTVTTSTQPEHASKEPASTGNAAAECTLDIGGMTCASCVGRVQKALTRADGVVTAAVNLATETATVSYDPATVDLDALTRAVEKAGYTAAPQHAAQAPESTEGAGHGANQPGGASTDSLDARRDTEIARLKRKWQVALTTGLGLMAVMYVPIHLDTMDWLMPLIFVVATTVQLWAGADTTRPRGRPPSTAAPA
jgi:Cu+-exporting ATPase